MALTRKALSTMGIEEDKIDQIISMHTETVNALKEERDKFKDGAEKLESVQKELDELKEKSKENSGIKSEVEKLKKEKEDLQKEFDQYKSDQTAKETRAAKEKAYREILKDAGIPEKHFAKVLKYSDVDGVELDDEGKIKTAAEILKNIKEEWSDHIESTGTQGAKTETPPANTGGKTNQPSRAAELARQYHENLYGKEEK